MFIEKSMRLQLDDNKVIQIQDEIERLKTNVGDLENYIQRSDRNRRGNGDANPLDELKEKVLMNEIKINDHD